MFETLKNRSPTFDFAMTVPNEAFTNSLTGTNGSASHYIDAFESVSEKQAPAVTARMKMR